VSDISTGARTAVLPWIALALLALPGMGVSVYLTYSHYADEATICAGVGSCELVQTSEYSAIAGVPVALMGLAYFVAVALLASARLLRVPLALDQATPAAFAMAIGGTAFVGYLTAVELFVLEAICPWCVSVAVMTVISLGFVVWARFAEASDEDGLQPP
jgi:uncharacterized membrane protein